MRCTHLSRLSVVEPTETRFHTVCLRDWNGMAAQTARFMLTLRKSLQRNLVKNAGGDRRRYDVVMRLAAREARD